MVSNRLINYRRSKKPNTLELCLNQEGFDLDKFICFAAIPVEMSLAFVLVSITSVLKNENSRNMQIHNEQDTINNIRNITPGDNLKSRIESHTFHHDIFAETCRTLCNEFSTFDGGMNELNNEDLRVNMCA